MNNAEGCGYTVQALFVNKLERLRDQDFCSPERPPSRYKVDHVELIEGPNRAQHDGRDHGRADHRHCDIPKFLPAIGAVHVGCFIKFIGNGLQGTGSYDGHKWPAQPDIYHQDSIEGKWQETEQAANRRYGRVKPADM